MSTNRFKKNLLLVLFLTISFAFSQKYTIESTPDPKDISLSNWVSDPGNLLSLSDKAKINKIINDINVASTAQIAVVILPSIGQKVPKMFAVDLFKKWGIGKAKKDNGLLILTIVDQRRTELETGYGLESILTDALCYRIASQELVPHFKKGNYGEGLFAGVARIQQILTNPEAIKEIYDDGVSVTYSKRKNPLWYVLFAYLIAMLGVFYHYFSKTKQINRNKEDFYDKYQDLYDIKHWIYMLLFPLPFIFIRWLFIRFRLSKYRNHKRFSKITGKEMFLKSEIEDDLFLNDGQILEEQLNTIDYDVWVTKDEDDILILSYVKPFSRYSKCPQCTYKTYYKAHTRTVVRATTSRTGLREIIYKCKNCGYKKVKKTIIPRVTQPSSSSSSFGGGGGFSGGSSFGGGSSGGGGAGVSW